MKRVLQILAYLLLGVTVYAQTGRDFWFSIPYVDKTHDSDGDNNVSNTTNYFRISTGEIGATVTFYKFTGGVQSVLYTASVAANSMTSVTVGNAGAPNISLSTFVIDQQNTILDRGIYISSTSPISIYYEIGSPNNTELFTLKGKDALGTEFYPVLQNAFPNKSINTGWCSGWAEDSWTTLDILASEANTVVTIDRPTSYTSNAYDTVVTRYEGQIKRNTGSGCYDDWTNKLLLFDKKEIRLNGAVIATDTVWLLSAAIQAETGCATTLAGRIIGQWIKTGPTTKTGKMSVLFAGSSITTVTLNKGNVYSIKAETQNAIKLLGGVKITATKPIGVVMKDDGVFDGSCGGDMAADLVGDQIVPSNKAGTAYIIPDLYEKITGAEPDQDESLFIRALADGIQISISGESNPVVTLNKGDVFRFTNFMQNNSYKVVTSNGKPFECYHLGGLPSNQTSVTEFAGALVPPVDSCTGSTITAFVRPESTTFRPILISRTNTVGSFKYFKQGDASWTVFNPTFTPVDINSDGTADWYYACDANVGLGSPTSGVNYLIKNSEATFHFGFLQKRQNVTSHGCFYGYFSDFTAPELLVGFAYTDIDPTAAVDMRVLLTAVGAKEGTYDWDLISPTPASGSCSDHYFPAVANCDRSNPITLNASILALNGSYKYKCAGDNTCKAGKLTSYVTFDVVATVATLPVDLYYFKAHCVSAGVMLEWATLSENQNKGFTLYRSYDGKNFDSLSFFAGQGTTLAKTYYSYIDTSASLKDVYYKLIQKDNDGQLFHSKVVSLTCNQSVCGSVYPTLCHQNEQMTFVCDNNNEKIVRIISMTGAIELERGFAKGQTINKLTLSIPMGTYVMQILEMGEIISQQQIVIW